MLAAHNRVIIGFCKVESTHLAVIFTHTKLMEALLVTILGTYES